MAEICFAYRPDTGEFAGWLEADPSPLEPGVWLYPAHTTTEPPPAAGEGTVAAHRDGAWRLLPDHRGETWFSGSSPVVVASIGDPAAFDPPLAREAAPQLEMVPQIISDRQFAQALALAGTITEAEALAWAARGELPDAMEEALGQITDFGGQRFAARMMLAAATTYERHHLLTEQLGGLLTNPATKKPYDATALDALWTQAAAL